MKFPTMWYVRPAVSDQPAHMCSLVIISTFYLGEIHVANTYYKSNEELGSFSSFNIK